MDVSQVPTTAQAVEDTLLQQPLGFTVVTEHAEQLPPFPPGYDPHVKPIQVNPLWPIAFSLLCLWHDQAV